MTLPSLFKWDERSLEKAQLWFHFLKNNNFNFSKIDKIDFTKEIIHISDPEGRQFSIDFLEDKVNYSKKKGSIKSELISKAMGKGEWGLKIIDLTAGLAIDSLFLAQLGYEVIACERNPLIYLCLNEALENYRLKTKINLNIQIIFGQAFDFINQELHSNIYYFDPMFPEKKKSALPKQEMVFFKNLVGHDEDASELVKEIILKKKALRLVVKRPLKADLLYERPNHQVEGKLIRFDIYTIGSKPIIKK